VVASCDDRPVDPTDHVWYRQHGRDRHSIRSFFVTPMRQGGE